MEDYADVQDSDDSIDNPVPRYKNRDDFNESSCYDDSSCFDDSSIKISDNDGSDGTNSDYWKGGIIFNILYLIINPNFKKDLDFLFNPNHMDLICKKRSIPDINPVCFH
jgi:hypothetical protein